VKSFIICSLGMLLCLPAWSQRASYDPAAKQVTQQHEGFIEFAMRQINPRDADYGCQIDEDRKLIVDETVKNINSWAVLVAMSFLILSFFMLLHQHRERNRREIIAASFLAQYHNALAEARNQAERAIRRYNELVSRTNTVAEAALRTASQAPEPPQPTAAKPDPSREVKRQSSSLSVPKDKLTTADSGGNRTANEHQNGESEGDLIAQISTLQHQLHASHEREKNLQKELTKARRVPASPAKETNIAG
jgi:hypothetical protein